MSFFSVESIKERVGKSDDISLYVAYVYTFQKACTFSKVYFSRKHIPLKGIYFQRACLEDFRAY